MLKRSKSKPEIDSSSTSSFRPSLQGTMWFHALPNTIDLNHYYYLSIGNQERCTHWEIIFVVVINETYSSWLAWKFQILKIHSLAFTQQSTDHVVDIFIPNQFHSYKEQRLALHDCYIFIKLISTVVFLWTVVNACQATGYRLVF